MPNTLDDLNNIESGIYDLSRTEAAGAGIPIIGSVANSNSSRVIVLEWSAFKEMEGPGGSTLRVGYAIRLTVTINKKSNGFKLTLPFIAASAELGTIEAQWRMQVIGLAGPAIDSAITPPRELNVEKYIEAQQNLKVLIAAARNSDTRFHPAVIGCAKKA